MTPTMTLPLREVATIERSAVQPADIRPGTLYVGLDDIESGGALLGPRMVGPGDLASTKFSFTEAHLLYGKLRPYLGKIAAPDFAGICSTDIVPILPGPLVDRRYLLHFLRQPAMVAYATSRSVGINLPRLSPSVLETFPVPLPSLPEQQRIAAILDQVDALRVKRREAIRQLGALTQSVFLDMFGDPIDAPSSWQMTTLAGAVKDGTIVTYGIVQAGEEVANGVPYIRTGDIVDGEVSIGSLRRTAPEIAQRFSRSRVEAGDIVMSIRATVGTTAVVPPEIAGANLTQGTARIAPSDKVKGTYLLNLLRTPSIQQWIGRQVKGATFREITLARLRELPVLVPPIALQQEFASRANHVTNLKKAYRASLTQLDEVFTSIQYRAFQGEL